MDLWKVRLHLGGLCFVTDVCLSFYLRFVEVWEGKVSFQLGFCDICDKGGGLRTAAEKQRGLKKPLEVLLVLCGGRPDPSVSVVSDSHYIPKNWMK